MGLKTTCVLKQRPIRCVAVVLALLALAGCATPVKQYSNSLAKNVTVTIKTPGSMSVFIDIYDGAQRCNANGSYTYMGGISVDKRNLDVGLPSGKPILLIVEFMSSGFGNSGRTSQRVAFTPKSKKKYRLGISYQDDMYDVTLLERDTRNGKSRKLNTYTECQ